MKKLYCPQEIEHAVQDHWHKNQTFHVTEDKNKKKYYCLSMMPYPSGNLHMGHVRNYTIGDVISRYQRMLGKNVLQPIGWDAFGLPAEQAAITNNTKPSKWTCTNIQYMKNQLKSLGFAYDWSREIITCHPQYYRWEQWFFTILYKKGLVYRKTTLVNWCPYHKTVLANEQVIDNSCWRCQTTIEYKKMPQWFIKITEYADQLLQDLKKLTQWPQKVKTMQYNWIGQSEKIQVIFKIKNYTDNIVIHTTRLDSFMGITYLTISTDHPVAIKASKKNVDLNNFIKNHDISITENIKNTLTHDFKIPLGIFSNVYAIHPINNNILPIWVSSSIKRIEFNGIGAIGSCPAHNQKDWEFAQQYKLPIIPVIKHFNGNLPDISKQAMTDPGILFNSDIFNGLSSENAKNIIEKKLINLGIAKKILSYKLKDWGISRQRYWGVPIPMVTLKKSGIIQPVPTNQLPVILPKNMNLEKDMKNPLTKKIDWITTIYDNQIAFRETDTFDTFMESSWYYARYTCPNYHHGMLDSKAANYWLPIDTYIGGIEHATMHLIYFRFYHKLMRDLKLVNSDEPATQLLCQGMILSDSFYYLSQNGQKNWISPSSVMIKRDSTGNIVKATDSHGNNLIYAGMCKMSKSKNNGIDPNIIIQKYGADAIRFFIMFSAPVHSALEWKESGIEGSKRFLKRLWNITYQHIKNGPVKKLHINSLNYQQKYIRYSIHKTILKVTDDINRRHSFNTALSAIMILLNKLYKLSIIDIQDRTILQEALSVIVRLLYPFTPHISFILWKKLGNKNDIDNVSWPTVDFQAIKTFTKHKNLLIIVQVNGKIKKKIEVSSNSDKNLIYTIAKKAIFSNNVFMEKKIKKIIYVPNKIINFLI